MTGLGLGTWNFEIKTFHEVSRSRPRPEPPGLETKTKTLASRSRDQDQDLRFQVSSELEFETLGLEITSLHPPVSPFLDPRSPLTSRSPKEPYPSLHRVSGMTCHLNSAPFLYLHHHHSKS